MVENQHSINSILSFGAKSVNPKILEQLLVGRENTVTYLYDSVKSIVEHRDNQFILIIGQRGMGKTHLLRVLYHRIEDYIKSSKIVVAYFSEEEYGVADYFDFLLRIINALRKWNENDKNLLQNRIYELQDIAKSNREYFAEKIIEDYIGKMPLLILTENFADILEAIKPSEQAKLRSWLYRVNKISIIATSQAISKDFEREDRPLYGTFNTYYLKKLTYEDTVAFLILLAETDKRQDVIDFINNKGKGQIKALHSLVKGNHRLLVTFYQFLKTNTLADLSENFIKTINDLKPYYETYIRNLPPQQQKVLRFIALNRKPVSGVEISKTCFIDQKSLTKQLSELIKKRLVEAIPNPNDKRNKLYDIDEPLLRISIEVGEHKEGITAIFIDFMAIYYNENELLTKKEKFNSLLKQAKSAQEQTKMFYEINAIEKAIDLQKNTYSYLAKQDIQETIEKYLENNSDKELYKYLIDNNLIKNKEDYYFYYSLYLFLKGEYKKGITIIERLLTINPNNAEANYNWGIAIQDFAKIKQDKSLLKESFEKYKKAIEINPNFAGAYNNWGFAIQELAKIEQDKNLFKESFEKFKKAIEINPNYHEAYYNWGSAIYNLAIIKQDENLYKESFGKYNKSIEINPNYYEAYYNWGIAITGLATLTKNETLFKEFVTKIDKAIKILPKDITPYELLFYGIEYMPKIKNISLEEILAIVKSISRNNISEIIN